jgi:hypothetical protein
MKTPEPGLVSSALSAGHSPMPQLVQRLLRGLASFMRCWWTSVVMARAFFPSFQHAVSGDLWRVCSRTNEI